MGSCGTKASSKGQTQPVVVVRPVQRNYAAAAESQGPNPVQVPEQPNDQQHAQHNPAVFQANVATSHEQHPQQQPGIVEQQRPEMARIDLAKAKLVEPERHATDDDAEEMFAQNMKINANAKPQLHIDARKQENKDHPVFALNFPMGGEDSPGHNQTPLAYRNRADSPTVEQKVVIKNRDKKVTDIINNPDESDDSMASPMYDPRIGNEDDAEFDVMNQGNGANHFGHYSEGRPTSAHK